MKTICELAAQAAHKRTVFLKIGLHGKQLVLDAPGKAHCPETGEQFTFSPEQVATLAQRKARYASAAYKQYCAAIIRGDEASVPPWE